MKKDIKSDITSLSEHDRKVLDKYSLSSYSLIEHSESTTARQVGITGTNSLSSYSLTESRPEMPGPTKKHKAKIDRF